MNQEIQETIAKLVNFLETISIQNPSLTLNYSQIAHFPMLVNSPSLFLTCLNEAASQIANYPVNVLKASSVSTLVQIRGTVVRVSSIVPFVLQMSFICSTCHNPTLVVLENGLFKTPAKCATFKCKSKSFTPSRGTEHDTKTTDYQKIRIQEKLADDQVDSGRIPRVVECEVHGDLVDIVTPGDVVSIVGIVKMLSTLDGKGKKAASQMYSIYVDVNSIVKASTNPGDDLEDGAFSKDYVDFSEKDLLGINAIKNCGGDNVFRILVQSLCPPIFGHDMVKAGLVLALLGGRRRYGDQEKEVTTRGDPHVLIVGDPGLGKSQMLSATVKIAPRGVYVCGNSTTTSGLTVTMTKDSETGETALEAGALVLADQGVCCIDEFDKMTEYSALLEAMEQQSISIAKAGLVCSLPARTCVIAAANPVGGHYNKAKSVSENLRMNSALLSRFDLVFILLDKPDHDMDLFISEHIMKTHSGNLNKSNAKWGSQKQNQDLNLGETNLLARLQINTQETFDPIPQALLRKYVAYARKFIQPVLSKDAGQVLKSFYLELRSKYRTSDAIPITTRQLESLIRLSEARARAELRQIVSKQDAIDVVEIMKYSLWESYKDEGGNVDFQRSQMGTGMSKKGEPKRFVAHLSKVAYQNSNNRFSFEELHEIAKEMNLQFTSFQDLLDTLNNQGYLLKKGHRIYQLCTAS